MASLALVSSDPVDTATDVSVEKIVTLTFDQNVKVASATGGTIQLFRDDADFPLPGQVVASGKRVTFIPDGELTQDAIYRIKIIGSDLGLGYALQAADGTFLSTTIQLTFRTGIEKFVDLSVVADRTDIERIGPIREQDPLFIQGTALPLQIEERDPEALEAKVSVDGTGLHVDFDRNIDPTTVTAKSFQVTQVPVLGLEEYLGTTGSDGAFVLATQLGVDLAFPTGTRQVVDDIMAFILDPGQQWLYNTEVRVTITTKVKGTDGMSLSQNDEYIFTTEYCPLYTSADMVRLEMGPAVSVLTDDTICRLIHKNSITAWERSNRALPLRSPPNHIKRWVLCRTMLDILNVLHLANDLQAGETKTLGDLTIRKQPRDPKLGALYADALKCLEENPIFWSDSMVAKPAVKGRAAPGERFDHRMRTWDHLLLQPVPGANLVSERGEKSRLSVDWAFAGKDVRFNQAFFVSVVPSRLSVGVPL